MGLLEDRIAIVTGAASRRGIGKAAASLFAEHGAKVAIVDLDAGQARSAAADLPGDGHLGMAGNVADKSSCVAVAVTVLETYGRIDALVNNAGIVQPLKTMEIAPEDYDAVTDGNLRGTLYMSQAAIPSMRARKSGSIVNLSSVAAQRGGGIFGGPHYAAAKAGVLGLTKAMARELVPDNVRVNAICPGLIDTDMAAARMTEEMRARALADIPLGRMGKASEVAGCALFLVSDLSTYCTGSEVDANGGSLIR